MACIQPRTYTLADGSVVQFDSPTVDDAAGLLTYLDRVRRETTYLMWGPEDTLFTVEQEREWVRSQVESADAVLIAVRAGGGIVGLGGVSAGSRFIRAGHRAELGISLLAEWCGRGLGTLLMRELVDWARRHPKITVLRLGVFAHNERAIAVYRKVGFEVEGRRRWSVRLADGSYADEVLMSLWTGDSASGSA